MFHSLEFLVRNKAILIFVFFVEYFAQQILLAVVASLIRDTLSPEPTSGLGRDASWMKRKSRKASGGARGFAQTTRGRGEATWSLKPCASCCIHFVWFWEQNCPILHFSRTSSYAMAIRCLVLFRVGQKFIFNCSKFEMQTDKGHFGSSKHKPRRGKSSHHCRYQCH